MLKSLSIKLNDLGDTIVEVLIAIAVLGLTFGIAYNIAIQSSDRINNNQFASQATQIIQAQVELLREEGSAYDSSNFPGANNNQCFAPIDNPSAPDTNCVSQTSPAYTVSIVPTTTSGLTYYTVTITWNNEHNGKAQSQSVYYYP